MNQQQTQSGIFLALGAFGLWGMMPIYFKSIDQVPAMEILGHRVIWSAVLLTMFLVIKGKFSEVVNIIKSPGSLGWLVLSSALIATNWLFFIWGVANNHILETSLGYFINPLLNVLLGMLFLGESLNRWQKVAIFIAIIAVAIQIFMLGKTPWIAFILATSFGFYGLVRKKLAVSAAAGLAVETMILLPVVIGYFYWLVSNNQHYFRLDQLDVVGLLMMAGVITTVPLILFNLATKKLSLTMIGIMQYLAPSISFLVGVFIYDEPLGKIQLLSFSLIWLALLIFTANGIYIQKKRQRILRMT